MSVSQGSTWYCCSNLLKRVAAASRDHRSWRIHTKVTPLTDCSPWRNRSLEQRKCIIRKEQWKETCRKQRAVEEVHGNKPTLLHYLLAYHRNWGLGVTCSENKESWDWERKGCWTKSQPEEGRKISQNFMLWKCWLVKCWSVKCKLYANILRYCSNC